MEAISSGCDAAVVLGGAALHSLSSQKHILPRPPPSDMHTWSTMNMLMSRFWVQLRLTFQSAEINKTRLFCAAHRVSKGHDLNTVVVI